tara:strand:- start:957 stop:1310 length:354 start_codon:yes stop_codon:yes gene_type:complete
MKENQKTTIAGLRLLLTWAKLRALRRGAKREMFDKMGQAGVPMDTEMKEAEEGANCLIETFREMGVEGVRVAYNEESAHMFVDDLLFASGVADNPVDAMDALYNRVTEKMFINPARA